MTRTTQKQRRQPPEFADAEPHQEELEEKESRDLDGLAASAKGKKDNKKKKKRTAGENLD